MLRHRLAASAASAALMIVAGSPALHAAEQLQTLDGKPPLVIAHRGVPGLMPEETQPAYELAADLGADALEGDLHLTKDCVLVMRHNPWLSDNTNIADVAKTTPEVAARKRTTPGLVVKAKWSPTPDGGPAEYFTDLTDAKDPKSVLKSLIVDGEDHTNDWSISDFTVEELKKWIGGTTYDARTERPTIYNGKFPIVTLQEMLDIAKAKSTATGRVIYTYPETKNPIWNNAQAIANGCGAPGSHPMEDALIKVLDENKLNSKDAPIFLQSFEPTSLKYMRSKGVTAKMVQLIDGDSVNYKTGEVTFDSVPDGRPFSWTLAGDSRNYSAMLTPAGLAEIKTYADGIGPWKPHMIPVKIETWKEKNADGTPYKPSLGDAVSQKPNEVIANAHKAGLFVHVYTFRNEKKYLAGDYKGNPEAELIKFYRAGVDGVFTDFTHTGVAARAAFLRDIGAKPGN